MTFSERFVPGRLTITLGLNDLSYSFFYSLGLLFGCVIGFSEHHLRHEEQSPTKEEREYECEEFCRLLIQAMTAERKSKKPDDSIHCTLSWVKNPQSSDKPEKTQLNVARTTCDFGTEQSLYP